MEIVNGMKYCTISKGDILFNQGDNASCFFILGRNCIKQMMGLWKLSLMEIEEGCSLKEKVLENWL